MLFSLESFLLFSQSIPSQDLGFVDSKATALDLTVNGRDLTVHQSPTILSSNRGGGTTGAGEFGPSPERWLHAKYFVYSVVWKITPLLASWMTSSASLLFKHGVLDSNATALELGCGISGILALSLGPLISSYILTDQEYVLKLLNQNLSENQEDTSSSIKGRKAAPRPKRGSASTAQQKDRTNISARSLDWETDEVTTSLTGSELKKSFDVAIACDCIYNDALIEPLVQTCVDVCRLRDLEEEDGMKPTVCVIAQQLRSADVFEGWLTAFHKAFRVWRVPDEELIDGLKSDSGFVIHVGILR